MRPYVKACLAAALAIAGLAGSVHPLQAQGLGDVARKEEERRKEIKAPARVYTNKDLGIVPGPPPATVSSSQGSPGSPSGTAPAETAKDTTKASGDQEKDKGKDAPVRDQAYWGGRKKALLAKVDSDQALVDAAESRINLLTADFADRVKALSELDRLHKSIEDGKKALTDLDEEARKAGVPPGWLR